jgi:lysophospholipase L1-like esterase
MYPWLTYEYKKKKKSRLNNCVLLVSFVLIAIGLSLVLCADRVEAPENAPPVSEAPRDAQEAEAETPPPVLAEETEEASVFEPDVTPSVSASASDLAAPPAEAADAPSDAVAPPPAETVDAPSVADSEASAVVSATASYGTEKTAEEATESFPPPGAADLSELDDYFSDALFIGDSRTQGLLLYSNLGNASYYAARGLTVEQVFKKAVVDSGDGKLTVSDALDRRAFGKVYLMFGLNELGWNSAEKFIEQYGLVLDRVRETQPDAVVYVQAIMPVSAWKSEKDPVHNNPNIDRFNAMIVRLAEEKNAIFLNVGDGVAGANGALPDEASSDGIHLSKRYCIKWEEYLRAHVV